jgi:hypothetical protein
LTKQDATARGAEQAVNAVQYQLILGGGVDETRVMNATLISPVLDPVMHPDGAVPVLFPLASHGAAGDRYALDSFQIDSLVDFLGRQADVRRALEGALGGHLAEWGRKKKAGVKTSRGPGRGIWAHVRLRAVAFYPRRVITPQDAAGTKALFPNLSDEYIGRQMAKSDRPDTRASFTVDFSAPWEDGCERLAEFRDGELLPLRVEGHRE